jgi:hypothetical protein
MLTSIQDRCEKLGPSAMAAPDAVASLAVQARLVSALRDAISGAGGRHVFLIETHI